MKITLITHFSCHDLVVSRVQERKTSCNLYLRNEHNTTTYTWVNWTWRTELQKKKMFYTEYMCLCACVRAERKSITWGKC